MLPEYYFLNRCPFNPLKWTGKWDSH